MFTDIALSQMSRVINCPGSVNICRLFPKLSKNYGSVANQSILAHWLVGQILLKNVDPYRYLNKAPINDNDQIVTCEMLAHVIKYCDIIGLIGAGQIKQRYKFTAGEFVGFGGYPDFIFYNRDTQCLTVLGLKYGFVPILAFRNWELLSYAWLFYETNLKLNFHKINSIKIEIYQPRIQTRQWVRKVWEIPFAEAENEHWKKIQESLRLCKSNRLITRCGDHCQNCHALLQCQCNLETCLKIVNLSGVRY